MRIVDDIVLFPSQVPTTPAREEVNLSKLGLSVLGAEWGEAGIQGTSIRTSVGTMLVDRQPKETTAVLKLRVGEDSEVDLPTAAFGLQQAVGLMQREQDSWLRRDFYVGGTFAGSLLCHITGEVVLGDFAGWQAGDSPDVTLSFVRDPIWYATTEDESAEAKEEGKRHLITSPLQTGGTAEGLERWTIKNLGAEDWRGLIFAKECRDYSAAATAELAYEAVDLTPMGGAAATAGPGPEVRAVGAVASGAAAISPGLPAGTEPGDLLIMVAESGGATAGTEANTALTASGWSSPPAPYEAQKKGNTRLTILYRIATGTDATTTNDTGDHQVARIIGVKNGTFDLEAPFNTAGVGTQAATKAVSIPGATTTRDNCLIVVCASGHLPDATGTAEFGAATNASLTGLAEQIDNTVTAGDGGALYAVTGIKAAKGAYSATTCTAVTEAERGVISLAVNAPAYVQHSELTAGWLAILGSEIEGVGHMTHVGTRRMWMRIYDPGETAGGVQLRLLWRALGSSRWVEDNKIVPTPLVDGWALVDLGECRPQIASVGDQRWEWKLMARAPGGSGAIRIRDVYPLPTEQFLRVAEPYEPPAADAQSTKSPGTVESVEGVGTVAWTNPSNAKASDDSRATYSNKTGVTSHYLKATNFGFALPESATVLGVVASVERQQIGDNGAVVDEQVRIVKGGAIGTADRSNPELWYDDIGVDAIVQYGAADDLWGETWTVGDINASDFGVAISARGGFAGSVEAAIDHIQISVYYTEAEGEDRVCFASRSIEVRSNGVYRQAPEDDVWGRVIEIGFPPTATPSGLEEKPTRTIIIPTQGDLGELPDAGTNKLSVVRRPRAGYHYARESI